MRETEPDVLFGYLDDLLEVDAWPDYSGAENGVQVSVGAGKRVCRVGAAVDASERIICRALDLDLDLLMVHHGLFWDTARPVTGRRYRKLEPLLREGIGLYSAHLPLDAHPVLGNCAVLARALGLETDRRFGSWKERDIGFSAPVASMDPFRASAPGWTPPEELPPAAPLRSGDRAAWCRWVETVTGHPVHLIPGGPEEVRRVGIVTGGGASFIEEAAREGVDTLITGEGAHHTWLDSHELEVNVLYAGHYATETWGVRALAEELSDRFGLSWTFLDDPSGL
ncbi:MAG: Nif3-like dinuclear metal center hexameric protein [Gemmatimonadales bacterium]|nr:MAG: Nif3-like dinuclear metal center hexameric protein [Gemmatimonadales bacterium]